MLKKAYQKLCDYTYLPVYWQPWWLEAASGGKWDVAIVEKENQVVGAWPYYAWRKYGLRVLGAPTLTPRLGPWLAEGFFLEGQKRIIRELLSQMPTHDLLEQKCQWVGKEAFKYLKLKAVPASSYYIPADAASGFSSATRRQVKKAECLLTLTKGSGQDLYTLICQSFARNGRRVPYSLSVLERLVAASDERGCGRVTIAQQGNKPVAGIWLVWDTQRMYYMAGGLDARYKTTGGMSLLIARAIHRAQTAGLVFDFEGGASPKLGKFFRGFGAEAETYTLLRHYGKGLGGLLLLVHNYFE